MEVLWNVKEKKKRKKTDQDCYAISPHNQKLWSMKIFAERFGVLLRIEEAIGLWVMFESRGNKSALPFVCSKAGFLDNVSASVALGTPFFPRWLLHWHLELANSWLGGWGVEGGCCPVYWRMLSRHPRPSYPLDASSKLPSRFWQRGMSPVIAKCPLVEWGWGVGQRVAKVPSIKNHCSRNSLGLIIELSLTVILMDFCGGMLPVIMRIILSPVPIWEPRNF